MATHYILIILVVIVMAFTSCTTPQPSAPTNIRETVYLRVTPGRLAQEYMVETWCAEIKASPPLPSMDFISTNLTDIDMFSSAGQENLNLLAAPSVEVKAEQWAEISVCSTNTPRVYYAEARIGEERIIVCHPAGVILKVKVEPTRADIVKVKGVLSITTEDSKGMLIDQRITPFFIECPMAKWVVVFSKAYLIPDQSFRSRMITRQTEKE